MTEQLVASIRKTETEEIRVTTGVFKDHPILGIRVWVKKDDNTSIPTQKGLACSLRLLPQLIQALQRAAGDMPPEGSTVVVPPLPRPAAPKPVSSYGRRQPARQAAGPMHDDRLDDLLGARS